MEEEKRIEEEDEFELVQQAFGSPGGKSKVASKLIKLIPEHKVYAEVFAGGLAVFWRKPQSEKEVINDLDSEISFAYKFLQSATSQQIEQLKKMDLGVPGRDKFFDIRDKMKPKNSVERFYKFIMLTRYSYGISRKTYGWFTKDRCTSFVERIPALKERLKDVKIYSDDYKKVIKAFDSKETFFYIDPPYPVEWAFDKPEQAFSKEQTQEMHDLLKGIKGRFLLSINNEKWIRDMFSDFTIRKLRFPRTFQKSDVPEFELLIANYDIHSLFNLSDDSEGIYVPYPYAKWMWTGKKSTLIKSKDFDEKVDKALYLVDKNYSYGTIRLHPPNKINKEQFEERRATHLVNDEDAKKYWGNFSELWEYGFDWIVKFEEPKRWKYQQGVQTFIENVEFLEEKNPIQDVNSSGVKEIINAEIDLTNLNFIKLFKDFSVIKDFVSIVGSTVKNTDGHKPHDIDLQIRMRSPENSYLRRAVEVRLLKDTPELANKLHFIWGDSEGSHDDFVPLYDLKLVRIQPTKIVKMSETTLSDIELFTAYEPEKPSGSAFYKIEDILDKFEKEKKYSVEYKANGIHCSIHKKGDEVKIFTEQKKDITSAFKTLPDFIKKLSDVNFVIDGELIIYDGDKVAGRRDLMKFIGAVQSGNEVDDSNVKVVVWDITYYNDKSMTGMPLSERIYNLSKLSFNDRISEVLHKETFGNNIKSAILWATKQSGSEGAVIKELDSQYKFGESSDWLKYRKLVDIDVVVIKQVKKERDLYNYLVGIYVDDAEKYNPKKIIEGPILQLGHTFNTSEDVKEGDIISILIEEIWKHESKNGIHYSIHKPRFNHITDKKPTTTESAIEDIVSSVGFVVVENNELAEREEGTEIMVKNFPKRMQDNFKKIMDKELWMPFVMDIHTIGKKLHRDFRLFIPNQEYNSKILTYNTAENMFEKKKLSGVLEGFTLFKPATVEESGFDTAENVQGTVKVPQPVEWLFFDGLTHKVGTAGTSYPGVFTIAAHGIYTIRDITDHKIEIEFRSDSGKVNQKPISAAKKEDASVMNNPPSVLQDFTGNYSLHVAHIEPEKWIILFDKLKHGGPKSKVTNAQIETINRMRESCSISEICRTVNLSPGTIYRYLGY